MVCCTSIRRVAAQEREMSITISDNDITRTRVFLIGTNSAVEIVKECIDPDDE